MPLDNIKRKKIFQFWERFSQTLSEYIPVENKIGKNKEK